ncbi:MAG: PfkB family carbohydrate kinase [Candidatus Krumholzibacteria bacterium]|nr:PfkB family carbohydrate kinase [Candidatus Krumholzibacteria bacterium]
MTAELSSWLSAMEGKKIVVWGDFAADHTVYGDTSRVSREAPVLILEKEWDSVSPGCAGNAIMNVAALGGVPIPVGVVGTDELGRRLRAQFEEHGIDTTHVLSGEETAIKMRVLAGGLHTVKQQVIRIDSGGSYSKVADSAFAKALKAALRLADGIIISDYGLGTVRPTLFASLVREKAAVSVVDSRYDLDAFKGAVSATPNEPELESLCEVSIGDDEELLESSARRTLRRLGLNALLVTRGKQGMALFEPRKRRLDIPVSRTQDIVDVTGAGDTVIATYTLALAAGTSFADAARLANVAAGLAVLKRGAAAPAAEQVRLALAGLE